MGIKQFVCGVSVQSHIEETYQPSSTLVELDRRMQLP